MERVRSLLVKPASSACNFQCDYCFYRDEAAHRASAVRPPMQEAVARKLVAKALAASDRLAVTFQGGEPALAGTAWYERFFRIVEEENRSGIPVSFGFQTNGSLIDDAWARMLRDHRVLVGVSLDGFPRLHNLHRTTVGGGRTSGDVLRGIACLEREQVPCNILAVVTNETAANVSRLWSFFTEHGFGYLQFIPCIDPIGDRQDVFLSPAAYGTFLIELFGCWVRSLRGPRPVSVRLFDNFLGLLLGRPAEECDLGGVCSVQYVVESDGSVYPCDFYCLDAFRLGDVVRDSFETLDARRRSLRFIESSPATAGRCRTCPYLPLCKGGCRRYRGIDGVFRFCASYRMFFDACLGTLQEIARGLLAR